MAYKLTVSSSRAMHQTQLVTDWPMRGWMFVWTSMKLVGNCTQDMSQSLAWWLVDIVHHLCQSSPEQGTKLQTALELCVFRRDVGPLLNRVIVKQCILKRVVHFVLLIIMILCWPDGVPAIKMAASLWQMRGHLRLQTLTETWAQSWSGRFVNPLHTWHHTNAIALHFPILLSFCLTTRWMNELMLSFARAITFACQWY